MTGAQRRGKKKNKEGEATLMELLSSFCAAKGAGKLNGFVILFFSVSLLFFLLCVATIPNVYNEKRIPHLTPYRSSVCFLGQCQTLLG